MNTVVVMTTMELTMMGAMTTVATMAEVCQ